jgi:hypothetical protein
MTLLNTYNECLYSEKNRKIKNRKRKFNNACLKSFVGIFHIWTNIFILLVAYHCYYCCDYYLLC